MLSPQADRVYDCYMLADARLFPGSYSFGFYFQTRWTWWTSICIRATRPQTWNRPPRLPRISPLPDLRAGKPEVASWPENPEAMTSRRPQPGLSVNSESKFKPWSSFGKGGEEQRWVKWPNVRRTCTSVSKRFWQMGWPYSYLCQVHGSLVTCRYLKM